MKLLLKEHRFDSVEEVEVKLQHVLTSTDFQQCSESQQSLWDRRIKVKGDYFEGENKNLDYI